MKKNIFKILTLSALSCAVLTGCQLDQFPDTAASNEEAWSVPSDAEKFNVNILSDFRGMAALGNIATDVQADYYQPTYNYNNRNGELYSWTFLPDEDAANDGWSTPYSSIFDANYYILNCNKVKPADANDSIAMRQYKAEAYFLRAYSYFKMAQRYCKAYDAASAAQTLGLPLVLDNNIDARPARSTLKQTVDQIESDIKTAISLSQIDTQQDIDALQGTNPDLYALLGDNMNLQMFKALQARIDLYCGKYQEAYDVAESLTEAPNLALASDAASFAEMWKTDKGSEFIFVPKENKDERSGFGWYQNFSGSLTNQFKKYGVGDVYKPDFVPSASTVLMYAPEDIRSQVFFKIGFVFSSGGFGKTKLLNKYPGNPALAKEGEVHTNFNAPKPFRVAEQYLIAAEAAYRLGNTANAQKMLNALRTARGLAAVADAGDDLFKDIQMEWKREFIGEGFRLNCLKRWHEGFTRDPQAQTKAAIPYNPQSFVSPGMTVQANDKRFVWEIPTNDLTTNKNLKSNW